MTLQFTHINGACLHYRFHPGTPGARPVVFLNSLGTDFRIWEGVVDELSDIPLLLMDKRGHGLSDLGDISIAGLAQDAAGLMDQLGLADAILCGVSVGGLIAQAMATMRPELVAGLVLCNTGAKIGDKDSWNARIEAVRDEGVESIADAVLERWFSSRFRKNHPAQLAGYRNMLTRTTRQGYAETCAAIRDTDLIGSTPAISVATICIGGSEDQATPPELVRELSGMIEGSEMDIIEGVGHLPCIEAPGVVAGHIDRLWRALT